MSKNFKYYLESAQGKGKVIPVPQEIKDIISDPDREHIMEGIIGININDLIDYDKKEIEKEISKESIEWLNKLSKGCKCEYYDGIIHFGEGKDNDYSADEIDQKIYKTKYPYIFDVEGHGPAGSPTDVLFKYL